MEMIESIWVVPSYAEPAPLGTFIPLRFDTTEGEIRTRAEVKNSRPTEGMGVKTVAIEHADRARLPGGSKAYQRIATQDHLPSSAKAPRLLSAVSRSAPLLPAEPFLVHRVDRAYSPVKQAISMALDIA